ncbi:hypothetical protein BMS3Abin16_00742 [archaeon BMS3Abin16]|nr:hypothetical protein BMS3Abin16_00742 [archaeon BMS3Abin16]GBE55871.1 hypothetical protein BMS3Bbin16_00066 [archaeon BMS3Bbin16]HDY74003.1 hypothetical protein [Euryarchaeota archaeon]
MSQSDIIDFLRVHKKKYFTEREIRGALGTAGCKVALKSLRRFPPDGFEYRRERISKHWTFIYAMSEHVLH